MEGTLRTFDAEVRDAAHALIRRNVEHTAVAGGARSELTILKKYDVTRNDAALSKASASALQWASDGALTTADLVNASEDFSFLANEVPGLFFFLGTTARGQDPAKAAPNHSPEFKIDEATLVVGVRALAALAMEFLQAEQARRLAQRPNEPSAR